MTSSEPSVTHIIPKGSSVGGVTSLSDDVFVVRRNSQQIHVEVYDAVTFTLLRCLAVPQLGALSYGLAVCPGNKCLYASDYNNDSVHRVELTDSMAVTNWSVARQPAGLTVNRSENLLVVSHAERKLQEFNTRGTLLQNIQLQLHKENPWQAIDLPSGQFVVSCSTKLRSVSSVYVNGIIIRRYSRIKGSQLTKINPAGLAVDKHGNILVADMSNHRLLMIDRSLTSAHEMSVSVDGGLNEPYRLWYDESRDRLYIGEWRGGRVIVIDHLKNYYTSEV